MIHLTISLNNIPEVVTYDVIEKLYLEVTALNYVDGDLVGNLQCTKAYQDSVQYLTTHFPNLSINVTVSPYIRFADLEVLRICTAQYGDGIGCTIADAANVSSFALDIFKDNTSIQSLNDLQYFTGISEIKKHFAEGCTNLTSVIIPPNVSFLSKWLHSDASGYGAFRDCTSLTNVQLNEGLQTIGQCAFYGCTSLTSIDIPSTVTTLGEVQGGWYRGATFNRCTNLATITGGENIAIIGSATFYSCSNLESIGDIDLSKCTIIESEAFSGCSKLDITIPQLSAATLISNRAFRDCSKISGAVDAPNLTTLGQCAFQNSGITAVLSLGNVTEIPDTCFGGCTDLTTINLSGITKIGGEAFRNCPSLSNVTIPQTLKEVDARSFSQCTNLLLSVDDILYIEKFDGHRDGGWIRLRNIADNLQTPRLSGTTLYLPNAKYIGDRSFYDLRFTTINIPNLETLCGHGTFSDNPNLTSVTLGGTFTTIEGDFYYGSYGMFQNCTSLLTVTITAPITNISPGMFCNAETNITQLNIDFDKITNIDAYAFVKFDCANFVLNFKNATLLCGYRINRNQRTCQVFDSISNISIYLPKITNINGVLDYYRDTNSLYGSTFKSEGNRVAQYNTIYLKDVSLILAGTFAKINIHTLIINNTTIPTLVPNAESYVNNLLNTYPTLNTDMFCSHGVIDNIYVPDSVVSNYQSDPAFSSVASIIKPISQCPTVTLVQQKAGSVGVISDYM